MTLEQILLASAEITFNRGVTVERYPQTSEVLFFYKITSGYAECFAHLQGDEADQFNNECNRIWDMVGTLRMVIVELALAEPYLILLENK